ncbi:MAG: DUF1361 domain-containing protein [Oscillatoriales cyanobacterium RM2_1_1]|nr:DUF1361 domain-containing protein [Oscillatoriales cyanobacterium SM2_3_0]NJO48024.1 DUF1361 domain-containing protein [Oscillatoriales cyanobacterium RM2_1_1]
MATELVNWVLSAGQLVRVNVGWMSWNLFLALIPVVLSFCLFRNNTVGSKMPRQLSGLWLITWVLLGMTFLPNARRVLWRLTHIFKVLDGAYLLLIILVTLILMGWGVWQRQNHQRFHRRSWMWWSGFLGFIFFLPNAPYVLTDVIHLIEQIRQDHSVWMITLALIPQYLVFIVIGFGAYGVSLINLNHYWKQQGWNSPEWIREWIIHGLCALGIYLGRFQRLNSWDLLTQPDRVLNSVLDNLLSQRPLLVIIVTFMVLTILYSILKPLTLAILSNPQVSSSGNLKNSDMGDMT